MLLVGIHTVAAKFPSFIMNYMFVISFLMISIMVTYSLKKMTERP